MNDYIAPHKERGASALLLASMLILLMGMAAIAIDIGAAFNERRQDQSAADAGALAAGLEFVIGNGEAEAVQVAKALVDENLGRTLPPQAWIDCTDDGALGETGNEADNDLATTDPCISFGDDLEGNLAFSRIRVRVPDQATPMTFARVLGFLTIETHAIAEVEMTPLLEQGAFPAAVFNGALAGSTVCIKTGTGSSNTTSCGDPSTGNFGNFNPYYYQEVNPTYPTSKCDSGGSVDGLAYIMANGLDHTLGIADGAGLGERVNGNDCPGSAGPINPDRVRSGAGYSNSDVTRGLVTGGTFDSEPYVGRFVQNGESWASDHGAIQVFGEMLDNRPLWTFLSEDQAEAADAAIRALGSVIVDGAPTDVTGFDSCDDAANGVWFAEDPNGSRTNFEDAGIALAECLTYFDRFLRPALEADEAAYPELRDGLFVEDLYDSKRITIVPEYHQVAPIGNNACCYDLKDFKPVYLNSLWTANGPGWTCSGSVQSVAGDFCRHDPGRTGVINHTSSGQRRINSADAIVLNCYMLPGIEDPSERCKKVETVNGSVTVFLNLFLTK